MKPFFYIALILMSMTAHSQDSLPEINSLWNYSDPAGTEEKFLEALPQARQSEDKVYLGELLTQIARTHSLRLQFKEARTVLSELEEWNLEEYPSVQVRYYLELGRVYNSSNDKDKAKNEFEKAWVLAQKHNLDYHAVDAAHMMVIASTALDDQITWTEKAIAFAEGSDDADTQKWLGALYNNVGWSYFDSGQYEKALEQFEKGLEWRLANTTNEQGIFIAKWTIARAHRALGNNDQALEMQHTLEKEMEERSNPDGYVYEELAEMYWETDKEKAQGYYKLAYEHLSKDKWLVNNEAERINKLKERAGLD